MTKGLTGCAKYDRAAGAATKEIAAVADHWDNAVAKSFFKKLKSELVDHTHFETRAAARLATKYIEG